MDFDEMKKWEQYCFREFYIKNPRFWLSVLINPREIRHVIKDGLGMLKFLREGRGPRVRESRYERSKNNISP